MAKDPALLFYTSDFLTGTMLMNDSQVGKYMRTLCLIHQSKGRLDRASFDSYVSDPMIRAKFEIGEEWITHSRITEEMNKRNNFCESRRTNRMNKTSSSSEEHMENENEIENVTEKQPKKPKSTFIPPTLEEVTKYCLEKGSKINPVAFLAHYETNGWVQGKNKPVRSWKACITTWEERRKEFVPDSKPAPPPRPPPQVVAVGCIAMGWEDRLIKRHLLDKGYSEHESDEAIMRARGKVE